MSRFEEMAFNALSAVIATAVGVGATLLVFTALGWL
jgi:hypothetical protein